MKTKLENTTLEGISGGYYSGTVDGSSFKLSQDKNGQFTMEIDGQNTQVFSTSDQLKDYLQQYSACKIDDGMMKEIVKQVSSEKEYKAGNWKKRS